MSLSPGHAVKVFQAGFECCFFNRLVDLIFHSSIYAFRSFGGLEWGIFVCSALVPRLRTIAGPGAVLLFGAPNRIGSGSVFESAFDFDGALRVHSGRNDLVGEIGSGRIHFQKTAAIEDWYGSRSFAYDRLYAYDTSRHVLVHIADRSAGEQFIHDLHSP